MVYLFTAILVFIFGVLFVESILYMLRWYEVSNRINDRDTRWLNAIWSHKARPLRTFMAECGYAVIYLASLAAGHLIRIIGKRGKGYDPANIDKEKPVVALIHGYLSSPTIFWLMRWRLKRNGIPNVVTFGYKSIGGESIEKYGELLRDFMLALRAETGARETVLMGHSLGGLIAHEYAAKQASEGEMRGIVALGSPFHGSRLAAMAITTMGMSLRPANPIFAEIVRRGIDTPFLAVYSRYDQFVLPYTNSEHPLADKNIEVNGCGHSGFYFNGKVFKITLEWLKGVLKTEEKIETRVEDKAI